MRTKQFKAESKRLLDLMINSIYTHKEIFLRELISNASDALDKLYYRELTEHLAAVSRDDFAIRLKLDKEARTLTIEDNGCGMTSEQLERVRDPFYTTRTTRPVGMGIPLFRMAAEATGGSLSITSKPGAGTTVTAVFGLSHIDRLPLGDMDGTVSTLVRMNPGLDFCYIHRVDGREFVFDTREIRDILGDVPLDDPDVALWLNEYLREQDGAVGGTA